LRVIKVDCIIIPCICFLTDCIRSYVHFRLQSILYLVTSLGGWYFWSGC